MDNPAIDLRRLGENVRFRRHGKGWALNDLAEKSGIGKAYISDLENGVAGKPNIQYVFAISNALGVTLDELLQDAAPKAADPQKKRRDTRDLPPGLKELQMEMNLSDSEVEMLAQVNFRGNRPKDMEGWRFLLEAIKMLSQRTAPK